MVTAAAAAIVVAAGVVNAAAASAAVAVFPLSRSLFISFSEILIAPLCNILLTHASTHTHTYKHWNLLSGEIATIQYGYCFALFFCTIYTSICH